MYEENKPSTLINDDHERTEFFSCNPRNMPKTLFFFVRPHEVGRQNYNQRADVWANPRHHLYVALHHRCMVDDTGQRDIVRSEETVIYP